MKILALLILSFTNASFASNVTDDFNLNPSVQKAQVVIVHGHPMTDVQPGAFLHFEFASCRLMSFEAEQTPLSVGTNAIGVTLIQQSMMDCHGPSIVRKYVVQLSSDYLGENYILLNPLAIIHSR